jgi:hypothetical protein
VAWGPLEIRPRLSDYRRGFDTPPDVNVFQRYQPRPLPLDISHGPSQYLFSIIADQGFVGLLLFLLLIEPVF